VGDDRISWDRSPFVATLGRTGIVVANVKPSAEHDP
jgi:hypothetical protein